MGGGDWETGKNENGIMTEKTINILGKDVRMAYCAATETGFERLAGKSINDIDFNLMNDLVTLAIAGIVAAYTYTDEEPPVTSTEVLYEATPDEAKTIIKTIIELRAEWYGVPTVVEKELSEESNGDDADDTEKNA